MVSMSHVEEQLKRIGCNFRFWGRPEIRELRNILVPGETIEQCVNGRYENGFALLCLTDHRLLLIDKKPMFLTLEDVRFDMISEIDYSSQLLEGTIQVMTPNRKLTFIGWNQTRLRTLLTTLQAHITALRHQYIQQQFQPQQMATVQAQAQPQPAMHQDFQYNRGEHITGPMVGGIVLQGAAQRTMPSTPYTRIPLILRRRRVPKFY